MVDKENLKLTISYFKNNPSKYVELMTGVKLHKWQIERINLQFKLMNSLDNRSFLCYPRFSGRKYMMEQYKLLEEILED